MITDKVRAEMRYYAEMGNYSDAERYEQFALDCKLDKKATQIGKLVRTFARKLKRPVDILETASATGLTAQGVTGELVKAGIVYTYTSLDIEANLLAYAKERKRGDWFTRGDFNSLPFADGAFDIYIMMGAEGYRTRGEFYREVNRVLKKGGYYVMPQIGPNPSVHPAEVIAVLKSGFALCRVDSYLVAKKY